MPELKPVFYFVNTEDGKGVKTTESDSVIAWLYANKQDALAKQFAALAHEAFDAMIENSVKKALENNEIQVSAAETVKTEVPTEPTK